MQNDDASAPHAWAAAARVRMAEGTKVMVRWAPAAALQTPSGMRGPLEAAADMEIDDEDSIPELNTGQIGLDKGRALVLFLHGAGQSSQTWATTVAELQRMIRGPNAPALVAYDARAHGATRISPTDPNTAYETMDKDHLVNDALSLLDALCSASNEEDDARSSAAKPTHVFIVGHSMGGAIACWLAQALQASRTETMQVRGLFVMDAVEELALASLENSLKSVTSRPAGFASLEAAVGWALEHGMTQNPISALPSMRGQLRAATPEEAQAFGAEAGLVWRTELEKSYHHWAGWFEGFSQAFVDIKLINKAILLAGRERLDQPMMVGHMQGFRYLRFCEKARS
ncbi:Protein phosphatase methylesterase 1 [Hondaea fermentalgiana]|uniref:protein phosphatase methylesterase-1 n=1 Tax=Hondaea fermentalgiana TaxID=2315210 RepID=A0A2R5G8T9_9STRA|nr:Protein phosphatase methylesterase 1 [Hondaea fermentalgiana]|eukprot:GBG24471.1 Protein phosphatase methylesterase 1 [Hondaea fermentalgiana]